MVVLGGLNFLMNEVPLYSLGSVDPSEKALGLTQARPRYGSGRKGWGWAGGGGVRRARWLCRRWGSQVARGLRKEEGGGVTQGEIAAAGVQKVGGEAQPGPPPCQTLACVRFHMKRELNQNPSGNEIHHTARFF